MAYVKFSNKGYAYYNDNRILFSSDNTHNYLLDYVAKDLSSLPKLFEKYVSKRIDSITFEQKENHNYDDLNAIKEILISAHPYYENEYEKVILKNIGDYFNELLIYSIFEKHSSRLTLKCTLEKDWYFQKLLNLIPNSIVITENYPHNYSPDDFYRKYKEWVDDKDYRNYSENKIEESIIPNVFPMTPIGFSTEIQIQDWANDLLYFILDQSAEYMEDLSVPQRAWIYGNLFQINGPEIKVIRELSFYSPALDQEKDYCEEDRHNWNKEIEYEDDIKEMFRPFYATSALHAKNDIPANLIDEFKSVTKYAKTNKTDVFFEKYEINNLQELLYLVLRFSINYT